jgi:hypothetical protein
MQQKDDFFFTEPLINDESDEMDSWYESQQSVLL